MFYKDDVDIVTILFNIKAHIETGYDYVLIISGDTGSGKSIFALNLLETWYRVILQKEMDESYVKNISDDVYKWVSRFKELRKYDMNIDDEGAKSLDSKDWMEKLSKSLTKLFNVFRKKGFFSVIILPSYWKLNKDFREDRLRGLVWINKRGEYKFYSKLGIQWLNANNEGKSFKSMEMAHPFIYSKFPDYNGILKNAYIKESMEGVDKTLDETIKSLEESKDKNLSLAQLVKNDVLNLFEQGKTHREIARDLNISLGTVSKVIYMSKMK